LVYHSTECPHSPESYRGHAREFLKSLEEIRKSSITDIFYSGQTFALQQTVLEGMRKMQSCERCGYSPSSNAICKACSLLEGLESGQSHIMRQRQDGSAVVPLGQRSIPWYDQSGSATANEEGRTVEGIERAVRTIQIET